MAKRTARRRPATDAERARIKAAIEDEKQHRETTLAQAREMRDASCLAREVVLQLRVARERKGLSLADLKERTGMSRESISRLENHEGPNPTIATLVRLAAAIGVKLHMSVR